VCYSQGNDLVAEVFYNESQHPVVDAINFNSYRVRSAAQTIGLHMGPNRSHATIVAFSTAAHQQQQQQQAWQSLRQQVSYWLLMHQPTPIGFFYSASF
jgi:hypothetical protein